MSSEYRTNILLVDDQENNLIALEALLDSLDQTIVKTRSGEEALKWLLNEDCAVILLDINMPGLDGFETAALIRERERSKHTPIIFITAHNTSDDEIQKGYSLGVVDYLCKPIQPEILKTKVAVFVDLFKKTEFVNWWQQQERELKLLDQLSHYEQTAVSAQTYGVSPLSKSLPDKFTELVQNYGNVMDLALQERAYKIDHHVSDKLRAIADELGFLKAGPRDVTKIHSTALKRKLAGANIEKAQAYVEEGRMLVLELMGYLVSFYRNFYVNVQKKYVSAKITTLGNTRENSNE